MAIKKSVLVRIAGENTYKKHLKIDPSKLKNIVKFPKDVFADYKGIRISIKRDEFDKMMENQELFKS